MLVDVPGYGFANAGKAQVDGWHKLINQFLVSGGGIQRVFILIDSRRGVQKIDEEVMDILDKGSSCAYQIILTKVDLLRPKEVEVLKTEIGKKIFKRPHCFPLVLTTSAPQQYGVNIIQAVCLEACGLESNFAQPK